MPDIWIEINTDVELIVNKDPLIDSSDGITIKTDVAYNETDMALYWNFIESDGTVSQIQIIPSDDSSAAAYYWSHVGGGMYAIDFPAAGDSDAADNSVLGFGWFSGSCDGVLPWISPIYGFKEDVWLLEKVIRNKRELSKSGDVWSLIIYDDDGTTPIITKALKDKDGNNITDPAAGVMAQELANSV